MKRFLHTSAVIVALGILAAAGHAFQRDVQQECATATQGDLGGWSVKNVCTLPIDLGLAWRVHGSNNSWSVKLTRGLNPRFQIDTPNCSQCVYDLRVKAFYSADRVPDNELRPGQ
jgi:hypothetical protein